MNIREAIHRIKMRLYVRPCRGCADTSPHTAHLTRLGKRHYTGSDDQ